MADRIDVYTDGSCSGNPGPGGWGAVILQGGKALDLNGGEQQTTNNRMELTAVIEALEYFDERKCLRVVVDSNYVRFGAEKWMKNWVANGWRTASKQPVKNRDLWQRLSKQLEQHDVIWKWVKAHANDEYNERANTLATAATAKVKIDLMSS